MDLIKKRAFLAGKNLYTHWHRRRQKSTERYQLFVARFSSPFPPAASQSLLIVRATQLRRERERRARPLGTQTNKQTNTTRHFFTNNHEYYFNILHTTYGRLLLIDIDKTSFMCHHIPAMPAIYMTNRKCSWRLCDGIFQTSIALALDAPTTTTTNNKYST